MLYIEENSDVCIGIFRIVSFRDPIPWSGNETTVSWHILVIHKTKHLCNS